MTDKKGFTPYGFGSNTISYMNMVAILAPLCPLIGGENYERIRRAAYCGGLEAAIVSIKRITGEDNTEANNDNGLRFNLARLDRITRQIREVSHA